MINRPLVNEPTSMQDNPRRGILLMIATTIIFVAQDGISRYLAGSYDIITIVAIRYWFFALFVCAFSARKSGGVKRAATSRQIRNGAVYKGSATDIVPHATRW